MKSQAGQTLTVIDPLDDTIVTEDVQAAGPEDVDAAVAAARAAFHGPWGQFTGAQRAKCMTKFADLIEQHLDELASLETVAMGQPTAVGKAFTALCPPGWRCKMPLEFLKRPLTMP